MYETLIRSDKSEAETREAVYLHNLFDPEAGT